MNSLFSILWVVFIWIISLINPSGFGLAFQTPEKSATFIYLLGLAYFLFARRGIVHVNNSLIFGLILTCVIIPYCICGKFEGLGYLSAFVVVYLSSRMNVNFFTMFVSCAIVGAAGIIVLYIYDYGSFFSGWNDNAISMIGLFSFVFFSIYLNYVRKKKKFIIWCSVAVLYVSLLSQTNCRSASIAIVLAIACIIFRQRIIKVINHKKFNFFFINFPLIVAIIVILIGNSSYFNELNQWSLDQSRFNPVQKGIFNGRNDIWEFSLELLSRSNYLGIGQFKINFHNSGIAALTVFGVLGYICWYKYFDTIISQVKRYIKMPIVYGCFLAFAIIFLQQTTDLGFIQSSPNYIPYLALGMAFGRVTETNRRQQLLEQRLRAHQELMKHRQ
jgi:hypothetical protein